ncbi:MAG: DUF1080 domain-containing protein [Pirellulaceae bacterium]|nr:DUF1080 domain-containing protein [Pirellulaceae bacterium]
MKQRFVALITLSLVLFPTACLAVERTIEADDSDTMPDLSGDGWVAIFNEKDTRGWIQRNGTATFRVHDGAIVGTTATGSVNSFFCTQQTYLDFELTFEVNVDAKLNSGVQIRSQCRSEYKNGRVYGPQVEIEAAPGQSGYLYSEGTGRSWISKVQPITDVMNNGQWNRFVVRARGDRLQTWINGEAICDLRDPESNAEGFIGLQVHQVPKGEGPYQVRWRDIRVRVLK